MAIHGVKASKLNFEYSDEEKKAYKATGLAGVLEELRAQNDTQTTSKYRGVHYIKETRKWEANIMHKCIAYYLGSFVEEEEAACAYDKKALELLSWKAKLNFPEIREEKV